MNEDLKKGNAGTDMKYSMEAIREQLYRAMKQETDLNIDKLQKKPVKGKYDFKHLCKVHEAIYNGVYDMGGKLRTKDAPEGEVAMGAIPFKYSDCENIEGDAKKILDYMNGVKGSEMPWAESALRCYGESRPHTVEWATLSFDERVNVFSDCMASLWKVHPFQMGNTRTMIMFFSDFAKAHGFGIDNSLLLDNEKYVRNCLSVASVDLTFNGCISKNAKLLRDIIKDGMERWKEQDKNREQGGKRGYGMKYYKEETQKLAYLGSNDSDKKYDDKTEMQFEF